MQVQGPNMSKLQPMLSLGGFFISRQLPAISVIGESRKVLEIDDEETDGPARA
jgi:hypothetical protein